MPRLGLDPRDQLRVLVCEGPSLLAWVGGFREEPYTQRDRRVLGALVLALRRRLGLERLIASAGPTRAALDAALDAIPSAAFLLTRAGAPVLANVAGRAALDDDPIGLRQKLADAAAFPDRSGAFRVVAVDSPGCSRRFLAVGRATPELRAQIRAAASRWGLSRRHAEVLGWLLEGASNARIGAELHIADGTVETHVTAILRRAQVGSRAELIVAAMRV